MIKYSYFIYSTIIEDSEYFLRVKESILAAMEGMPDSTRFGLITFDDRVGIWNLEGLVDENSENISTRVNYIPIPEGQPKIDIHQVISPERFLVNVRNLIIILILIIINLFFIFF